MKNILLPLIALTFLVSCNKDLFNKEECSSNPNASTIVHNNVDREYILYVPSTYNGNKEVPLYFNFHGFGGDATTFSSEASFRSLAETDTFIVVYPQGSCLDGVSHWNASPLGGDNKSTADDFGFIEALINELSNNYQIDRKRIYASGYSNGGMMAYGLAQCKSELIAAVGSVSGSMLDNNCFPSHPIPVISIHGTNDNVLPYNGNSDYNSVSQTINYWTNFNQTNTSPIITSYTTSNYSIEEQLYTSSDSLSEVVHYKINGGEHIWFQLDVNNQNTQNLLWNFMSKYNIDGLIQ